MVLTLIPSSWGNLSRGLAFAEQPKDLQLAWGKGVDRIRKRARTGRGKPVPEARFEPIADSRFCPPAPGAWQPAMWRWAPVSFHRKRQPESLWREERLLVGGKNHDSQSEGIGF